MNDKKYEYTAFYYKRRNGNVCGRSSCVFGTREEAEKVGSVGATSDVRVVIKRREVGEWEDA